MAVVPTFPHARLVTLGAVLFALANALYSAWDQGWTYDEPFHLEWTQRLLEQGVGERESKERFNSKTPVILPNVLLRKAAAMGGAEDPRVLRLAARVPSVVWLLALLAAVFGLTRRFFGPAAAHLATTACALDPNLVAHGSLATVDAAYALATLLTLWAALLFAGAPTLACGAALGLALGFAFATKFTAFLLLPGLLVLPFLSPAHPVRKRDGLAGCAAAALTAWAVICGMYLFREMAVPFAALPWRSGPFVKLGNAFPSLAFPLPAAFLTGIDSSLASERGGWNVVILGRRHPQGAFYYFALVWLLKTPLSILAGQVAGLVRAAREPAVSGSPAARLLAWNLVLTAAYFSLLFNAQIGYRFVLMAIPLACILAAAGLSPLSPRPAARRIAAAALALAVLENALYFGNPLAFTNGAVQPKRLVYRLIADSNIDWGQDRERIHRRLEKGHIGDTHLEPLHILPGHNTLGLNALAGVGDFEQHRWVREYLSPLGHFGHTYLWFDVDDDAFDRFLGEARQLAGDGAAAELCAEALPLNHLDAGARVPFSLHENPVTGRSWAVCLVSRKGGDFGLKVQKGRVWFGRALSAVDCQAELVGEGQVSWYRLEPGRHAICAVEVPNRRPWLPYALEGTWMVRGHGAEWSLRRAAFREPTPPARGATTPRSSSPPPPPGG